MIGKLLDMQIFLYCMIACGALGAVGMVLVNRKYRKRLKLAEHMGNLKKKWKELWNSQSTFLHHMNRWVWYPSLACLFFFGTSFLLNVGSGPGDGLALRYLYVGMAVPLGLLLLRQGLDFSYRGELMIDSVADYVEETMDIMEEKQVNDIPPRARDEMVEHIAKSIKESAATQGKFGLLLSPEEEEIMREIIREFME